MSSLSLLVCPIVGLLVLLSALRRVRPEDRRLIQLVFGAHVAAAVALVVYHVYVYGGGDMFLYSLEGQALARLLREDFSRYAPEVMKLAVQRENDLPIHVLLEGTSSGTISALSGLLMLATGNSVYGACILVSYFSFYGALRMFEAIEWKLRHERAAVMLGVLCVPSVIFWTSGIVKEAFVVGSLGVVLGGLADFLRHRRVRYVPSIVLGCAFIALIKPYVLMPLALSIGAWFYAGSRGKLSLFQQIIGVAIAVGGLLVVAKLFPEFSPGRLGQTIALQQKNYSLVGGGSSVDIGDLEEDYHDRPLSSQLPYVPLALLNALLRPFLFEARNPAMLLAAIEMTCILWWTARLIQRHGIRTLWRETVNQPHLMFAAVFVVSFSVAVGLATRNLGTLSRYRVPAMPLFYALVLGLRGHLMAPPVAGAKAGPVPPRRLTPQERALARRRRTGSLGAGSRLR